MQFILLSAAIVCAKALLILWCTKPLAGRARPWWLRLLLCLCYCGLTYFFNFVYKPKIYVDALLINGFLTALLLLSLGRCPPGLSVFYGLALTACYQAARYTVILPYILLKGSSFVQFEALPLIRGALEALGALIALLPLSIIRRWLRDMGGRRIGFLHTVALLQPILITLIVNIWLLPGIDPSYPQVENAPVLIAVLSEIAVIYSAMLVVQNLYSRQKRADIEQLERLVETQHAALMERNSANEAIERLAHDIKNHLCCIQSLSDSEQIESHISGIRSELQAIRRYPYTGNSTLDIILNEKAALAKAGGLELQVLMDFSGGGFLESVDICAIFANALDNALEAAGAVCDPHKRVVTIKSACIGSFLSIRVNNYFAGGLLWHKGRLLSKKRGGTREGYGIRSMEHSLAKYRGEIKYFTEEDRFCLLMLIPIPGQTGREGHQSGQN